MVPQLVINQLVTSDELSVNIRFLFKQRKESSSISYSATKSTSLTTEAPQETSSWMATRAVSRCTTIPRRRSASTRANAGDQPSKQAPRVANQQDTANDMDNIAPVQNWKTYACQKDSRISLMEDLEGGCVHQMLSVGLLKLIWHDPFPLRPHTYAKKNLVCLRGIY